MDQRIELLMQVDGLDSEGGVEAVTRAVKDLDPEADVAVDLAHGRISVTTRRQSLDVAAAIQAAGFEARAMTL